MQGERKISPKIEQRIAVLLTVSTTAEAAQKCQVSESTIYRWLQDPVFFNAYRDARRQVLNTAVDKLQQITEQATETLERNMKCGQPSVEVRAALGVLALGLKVREFSELEESVRDLEENVEYLQRKNSPGR